MQDKNTGEFFFQYQTRMTNITRILILLLKSSAKPSHQSFTLGWYLPVSPLLAAF